MSRIWPSVCLGRIRLLAAKKTRSACPKSVRPTCRRRICVSTSPSCGKASGYGRNQDAVAGPASGGSVRYGRDRFPPYRLAGRGRLPRGARPARRALGLLRALGADARDQASIKPLGREDSRSRSTQGQNPPRPLDGAGNQDLIRGGGSRRAYRSVAYRPGSACRHSDRPRATARDRRAPSVSELARSATTTRSSVTSRRRSSRQVRSG